MDLKITIINVSENYFVNKIYFKYYFKNKNSTSNFYIMY